MSLDAAKHLLDEFNDGNWNEVGAYFNFDFGLFFNYLNKYNLGNSLNYKDIDEDFKNIFLLENLKYNREETLNYICDNIVTDVYPRGGNYYLHLNGREELAKLFKQSYRYGARDVAESVLGDDYFDLVSETTNDIYDDVISVLDEGNKNILAHYIIKNIGNQEISLDDYEDQFFYDLSEEQGTEGFFKLTSDNVMGLIDDNGAMTEMLKNDLDYLKLELYSIHSNAYNTAYTDEIYNDVWSELGTYFDKNDFQYETKTRYDGKTYNVEYLKINDFGGIIYDFLKNNIQPEWSEQYLEYYGELIGVMTQLMEDNEIEWLDFSVPDYPDWSLTKKYINEIFSHYI